MRMHTDKITLSDLEKVVAGFPTLGLVLRAEHGSKTRARAFEFFLEGSGLTGGQWGSAGGKTATWDEWGVVIAELYKIDPDAHFGKHGYQSAEHFHWVTCSRYRTLKLEDQHRRHKWRGAGRAAGNHYRVITCEKCGAHMRQLTNITWPEFERMTSA